MPPKRSSASKKASKKKQKQTSAVVASSSAPRTRTRAALDGEVNILDAFLQVSDTQFQRILTASGNNSNDASIELFRRINAPAYKQVRAAMAFVRDFHMLCQWIASSLHAGVLSWPIYSLSLIGQGSGYDTQTSVYADLCRQGFLTVDSQEGKCKQGSYDETNLSAASMPWLQQHFGSLSLQEFPSNAVLRTNEISYVEFYCTLSSANWVYDLCRGNSDVIVSIEDDPRVGGTKILDSSAPEDAVIAGRRRIHDAELKAIVDRSGGKVLRASKSSASSLSKSSRLFDPAPILATHAQFVEMFCAYRNEFGDSFHPNLVQGLLATPLAHLTLSWKEGCSGTSVGSWLLKQCRAAEAATASTSSEGH
jgi:hypothetical protein